MKKKFIIALLGLCMFCAFLPRTVLATPTEKVYIGSTEVNMEAIMTLAGESEEFIQEEYYYYDENVLAHNHEEPEDNKDWWIKRTRVTVMDGDTPGYVDVYLLVLNGIEIDTAKDNNNNQYGIYIDVSCSLSILAKGENTITTPTDFNGNSYGIYSTGDLKITNIEDM